MEVNEGVEVAEDYVWNNKVKIGGLLIKFMKFITINLKFKWNFFNS